MGCHFCHEELFAILMVVPFLRTFWLWMRSRYHRMFGRPKCGHDEHTCHPHTDVFVNAECHPCVLPAGVTIHSQGHVLRTIEQVTVAQDGGALVQAVPTRETD